MENIPTDLPTGPRFRLFLRLLGILSRGGWGFSMSKLILEDHESAMSSKMTRSSSTRSTATRFAARATGLALVMSVSGVAVAQQAGATGEHTYAVSQKDSELYVQVYHERGTLASGFAHDHVIRAGKLDGQVRFDPAQPAQCRLTLNVPVRGLVVDAPAMRREVGYKKMLDEGDRKTVREHMLDDDQLDAGEHPTIKMVASDCQPAAGKADVYNVRLAVTVRGKTKTRTVPVRIRTKGHELSATSAFNMKHSDFGMEPYSALLGAVKVAQPIRFVAKMHANAE